MDLEEKLNAVGKTIFVKYYFILSNLPEERCLNVFMENFTKKSKRSRISHAKEIFWEGKQFDALRIVCNSPDIDPDIKRKAEKILFELNR